ncbi:MAG: peptidoglycan DD-metalloendopeptidase family protein [Burkholderiaceae bacterium]
MTPIDRSRFPKVAAVVAAMSALVAVTAFGTAPLRDVDLPPIQTVIEAVPLAPHAGERFDSFVQTERIQRGETLSSLLNRLGATDNQFHRFVATYPGARKLLQLQTGRTVTAEIDAAGRVQNFQYRYGNLEDGAATPARRLTVRRDGDSLTISEEQVPVERFVAMGSVEIRSSLFAATDAAGIPEAVATQIADILDGEVDFKRDLRRGDRLRVAYELVADPDSLDAPRVSRILALELINNQRRYEAVWFERNGQGEYFTFAGRSLRKAFLRHPVEFSRISSGFNPNRTHPIFGFTREHKGVDFAAPRGTKVRSSGDGVIEFVGQQRGYGNVVIVKHANGVSTLYAHLDGFADNLSTGAKIAQSEVIGFVGSTGWATGPHLHYEFIRNGEHVDPMTVAMAESIPLAAADMARFKALSGSLRTQLAQIDDLQLARFE